MKSDGNMQKKIILTMQIIESYFPKVVAFKLKYKIFKL